MLNFQDLPLKSRAEKLGITIIFLWFLFQVVYFAQNIPAGISPDEVYHISLSEAWSKSLFQFKDTPETFKFGPVSRHPYLYHLLMGLLLQLRPESSTVLQYLRFLNIGISVLGFWVAVLFLKKVTQSSIVRLSTLYALSSTLMFVFISGMVSYDTLFYLLSSLTFYLIARLSYRADVQTLLILAIVVGLGNLTKISFAPLAVIAILISFIICKEVIFEASFWWPTLKSPSAMLLTAILAVIFGLNLSLYLKNIITFQQILPLCPNVLGHNNCLANPEYVSDLSIIAETRGKKIDGFLNFFVNYTRHIERQIPGIFAHRSIYPNATEMVPHRMIGMGALAAFIWRLCSKDGRKSIMSRFVWPFILMVILYSSIIVFQNYTSYRKLALVGPGIQFRYHFPILLPFLYVFLQLLLQDLPKRLSIAVGLIICTIFSINGFSYFMRNADSNWHIGSVIR